MYVYHGTNQKNAISIMENGFRTGTYFTSFLDAALCYGGEYVFACWVDNKDYPGLGTDEFWQFQIQEPWTKDRIVSLVHYNAEMLYVNEKFCIHEQNQQETCPVCHGAGESFRNDAEGNARHWLPKTHYLHQTSLKYSRLCGNCHGYGDLAKMRQMRQDESNGGKQ